MSFSNNTIRQNKIVTCFIEELVPQDHLVRKLEAAIDFSFIYPLVRNLYSTNGRPCIDPVVLFKMLIINIVFGLNSMRRTCREIEVNVAYRWYLGLDLLDKIPDYSTWSQNYIRRYKDSDIFEEIFEEILTQAYQKGFVDFSTVFGDSTHQKANANKRKSEKKIVDIAKKKYEDELLKEINEDRECIGKSTFESIEKSECVFDEETGKEKEVKNTKTITVSTTDPESGCFHKGEKERCFAYSHQTMCDKNGFVLGVSTVPGNVHDSVSFFDLYDKLMKGPYAHLIKNVSLDAGYYTPAICRTILENNQKPFLPYKRPMTKKGFYKKYEYVYDEEYDCYICPNEKLLIYSTTTREGYRQYKSDPKDCSQCPLRGQCTQSKNMIKVINRHLWERYREQTEEIRHTKKWKEIYPKRKETIERVFADCKENNGLRFTRLRGLKKNQHHAWLIFACHNLKRMALWSWKGA
ncbi:IS1182 family transposase [Floccifex sp.]|uniref:IS1182 family transposase n=1 Tax=Floccifex sp. TaxID=2815810 RepID=UPI002A747E39|nr:IS1182 family transposase [Floccifex sp.]MDY2957535.1 IS1182 family transposase [Floccifex sp.]